MATANSFLTTAELYSARCMAKRIKVHLGYWLAQACHQMTANPSRQMYTFHLLGAYLQCNIVMKIGKAAPEVLMCEPPELFGMEFFFNKGLLYMDSPEVCFYDIGTVVDKVKKEMDGMEAVVRANYEELRKEMTVVREELGGVRLEIQANEGEH